MKDFDAQLVIQALELPDSCKVDQRVPKKLLLENGAFTTTDKRLIAGNIAEIQWVAVLKPNTIGVPDYRDTKREYLEVAMLVVTLKGAVKSVHRSRLAGLVHRAVPYPVLLQLIDGQTQTLFLAHKRWAQNEYSKVVLDGGLVSVALFNTMSETTVPIYSTYSEVEQAFMQSLSVTRQPQITLYTLYQGWIDCVRALLAARLTGSFRVTTTLEQGEARRQALADYDRLEGEISRLRGQAIKEKQVARQVEVNLRLQARQTERKRIEKYL